jgi:hypothetical protein
MNTQMVKTSETKECPFCGEEISVDAIKCRYCREFLDQSGVQSRVGESTEEAVQQATCHQTKTPAGLIVATWVQMAGTFIPGIGIFCSIGMLVTSIMLVRSRSASGRINGIIALVIWGATFLIGFGIGLGASIR